MTQDRRTFLKTATLVGAAAAASAVASSSPARAQTAARRGSEKIPRGLTFATLKRDTGYGLGLRTERGILDVVAAEQDFHENAPTTIRTPVFAARATTDGLKRLNRQGGAPAPSASK